MSPQLIIAAVIATSGFACGFGAAWRIQAGITNTKEKAHAEQKLAQVQHSAAVQIRRADNVIIAQNESSARAVGLRRDLGSAHTELERLRTQLAQPLPGTGDTTSTCVVRADPARELLAECATELQDLAGKADRHANDALTLQQAWPK